MFKWLAFLLYIWEVSASNVSLEMDYSNAQIFFYSFSQALQADAIVIITSH